MKFDCGFSFSDSVFEWCLLFLAGVSFIVLTLLRGASNSTTLLNHRFFFLSLQTDLLLYLLFHLLIYLESLKFL